MKCEFDYCIYNNDFICILDEIQMNSLGMCEECEIVAVSKDALNKYKQRRLKEINRIWKDLNN